jgi:thiamine-monophosphate kinase
LSAGHDPGLGSGPEFDLIRRFLSTPLPPGGGVLVGPGDDAAVLEGGIVLSTDMSVEDVHFRRDWLSPEEIGYRAAAAAFSDLAAMAAEPLGLLASLGVPVEDAGEYAVRLMAGVSEAAREVGTVVLGGDLARTAGPVVLDCTVVGRASRPVLRSGARVGDEVWVTGTLGGAACVVKVLMAGRTPSAELRKPFARPRPRIAEALWLARLNVPTAMLDLSDGVAGDAGHIAAASGVALHLEAGRLPLHPALSDYADTGRDAAIAFAAGGGEDYELLFTAAPGSVQRVLEEFRDVTGTLLTRIGVVEAGMGVVWADRGMGMPPHGYQHFTEAP